MSSSSMRSFDWMNSIPSGAIDMNKDQTISPERIIKAASSENGEGEGNVLEFYEPPVSSILKLKEKLDFCLVKFRVTLVNLISSYGYRYSDTDGRLKLLLERLINDHENIVYCLENLGLIGAYEAVEVCKENAPDIRQGCGALRKGSVQLIHYLEQVSSIIQESLPLNQELLREFDYSSLEAISSGYISPKLQELLRVLMNLGKESSLILVERTVMAEVIARINAPMPQVHLLFATDVVEEGIDISHFSRVVYFDLPKNIDSYVISCELARQHGSQLIIMLERENLKQRDHLFDLNRHESSATNGWTDYRRVKDYDMNVTVTNADAGTKRRKELHGTTTVQALSGTWGGSIEGFSFHAYELEFTCINKDYSSFILLLESELDNDVGNHKVDLYPRSKFVQSSVSPSGQRYLSGKEVANAKRFQELFFNGIFGKLFVGKPGEKRFLLETQEALWDPSKMYLLLPLKKPSMKCAERGEINWPAIESSVSVVEFLKNRAFLNSAISNEVQRSSAKIIHLANKSVGSDELKNMVVVSIHTGNIYSVIGVAENSSAMSRFESPKYSCYTEYFSEKYKIALVHVEQPLLQLKQTHKAYNLLVDFKKEQGGGNDSEMHDKERFYVHMPPELLISVDISVNILNTFYLLPSLMYRLESLMLSSQLRRNVGPCFNNLHIPSSELILEAITTLRCNEAFSMERLEWFGDSVIKYAVSCTLFLKYPEEREGQLSTQRTKIIRNSALRKLGIDCNLQGYIRDDAFDLNQWTAPGQLCGTQIVVGKSSDRVHRWMGSKIVADCVEALIGAYYVGGEMMAALHLMKWMGFDVITDHALVHSAIHAASLRDYSPKVRDIKSLEAKVGYEFTVKGLLLEAITHGSLPYQRLEFLGDAVLDILVTRYLYYNHLELNPGELTALRAASVSNDNFALVAVKKLLHPHLQCCTGHVIDRISVYVKSVSDSRSSTPRAPKVLGDMVESIAGAILIDSLSLDEVWRIFEPLLSPIATPEMRGISYPNKGKKRVHVEHNENQDSKRIKLDSGRPLLSYADLKNISALIPKIELKQGGPRSALFALCNELEWPVPTFECSCQKSRDEAREGTGFNCFESKIKLTIPNSGTIEVSGEAQPDKEASCDSAALAMLSELGIII